jgi:hypothetical protein
MFSRTKIITETAAAFDLTMNDMTGRELCESIAVPRMACYLLLQRSGCSTTMIGRLLGGRDHSTVSSGIASIKRRMGKDPELSAKIVRLIEAMQLGGPVFIEPVENSIKVAELIAHVAALRAEVQRLTGIADFLSKEIHGGSGN